MSRIHNQYLIELCHHFSFKNCFARKFSLYLYSATEHKKKLGYVYKFFVQTLTCIESALIISPPNRCASSIDNFVFPVPVEPKITINGTFRSIFLPEIYCFNMRKKL